MNVLVTGGAGFIGNTLTLRLVREGHEVVVVDNVNDYYDPSLKEARLARLPKEVRVERIDITDYSALDTLAKECRFDRIAHLAAFAGVRYSLENPFAYAETNYLGTQNLFELAKRHGIEHVVFASTSAIYGDAESYPVDETTRVDKPVSIYAASKRANELLAYSYFHLFGSSVTALRFFTVYGPWGRPDMALFLFTKAMLEGEPIQLFNSGKMHRDFTYVDDIVEGFVRALEHTGGFEIYNLGRGESVYLLDFVKTIEHELGVKAKVTELPMQPGDVEKSWANIDKARKELGYEPKVSIEEGVKNFIAWYREYYKV